MASTCGTGAPALRAVLCWIPRDGERRPLCAGQRAACWPSWGRGKMCWRWRGARGAVEAVAASESGIRHPEASGPSRPTLLCKNSHSVPLFSSYRTALEITAPTFPTRTACEIMHSAALPRRRLQHIAFSALGATSVARTPDRDASRPATPLFHKGFTIDSQWRCLSANNLQMRPSSQQQRGSEIWQDWACRRWTRCTLPANLV